MQTILEAGASGAKVCYFGDEMLSFVTLCKKLNIAICNISKTSLNADFAKQIDIKQLKKLSFELNYSQIFLKLNLSQFKFK